jgi:hypothetical protein
VKVYEIPLRAVAGDGTQLHVSDVAGVGYRYAQEPGGRKEHRIYVSEEAHLGFVDRRVERVRRFSHQGEGGQHLESL